MKNSLIKYCFLVLCVGCIKAHGQNDFFFNHYMFNPSYFNPAWAGSDPDAFLAAHHRTQWAGYNATFDPGSAPSTQLVSLVVPAKGLVSGFGITAVNDRQFGLRSNQIRFQVSLSRQLSTGTLSLGLAPSINIQSLDPGDFRPSDPTEQFGTKQSQLRPNFHAGIKYEFSRYEVGLSVENIIEPQFNLNGFDQLDYFQRNVNLFVIRDFGISRDLIIRPSLLARADPGNLSNFSLDLTAILEYQNKMWGGVAFKRSEAISILLGYTFLDNQLKAGYSFDYVVQEQDAKEPTSHEIFIRYNLPDLIFGGRKAVKTPRFAF